MKWTALFLLIAAMHIYRPVFAQQVSINAHELPLELLFEEISRQTHIEFFYEVSLVKERPVTMQVEQMPLEEVMAICLKDQGLQYKMRNGTIVIFKPEDTTADSDTSNDTLQTFTGHVSNSRGVPLEGASVVLARSRLGTQTNRSGDFMLKVKKEFAGDSMVVSSIGCHMIRIALNGKSALGNLVLESVENALDEVIAVAYGTSTDRYRTGDITTVRAVNIEKTPTLNVIEALAGRVAGLSVRQNGSNPGSVFNIQLRGINVLPSTTNMLKGNAADVLSKPLIVLDGFPMPLDVIGDNGQYQGIDAMTGMAGAAGGQDPLYFLNPLDIESITVLKDAEATALYGSRAANGVIIITTKRGRPGKAVLNLSLNTGFHSLAKGLNLMNTKEYLAMRSEAVNNFIRRMRDQNIPLTPELQNFPDLQSFDQNRYVDWQETLLGNAPVYNFGVALSGGEEHINYRVSAGFNRFNSSYPHPQGKKSFRDDKGTILFSLSSRSQNNRLKMNASISASTTMSSQPSSSPDSNIFLAPNAPDIFNQEGSLNFGGWNKTSGYPLRMLAEQYQSNRFTMLSRITSSFEIFKPLVFTLGAGYLRSDGKQIATHPFSSMDPASGNTSQWAIFGTSSITGFNLEPNLNFKVNWSRHHLDILAGVSYESDRQEGQRLMADGYISEDQMNSIAGATFLSKESADLITRRSVSGLARISYRYDDKWLLDLSARRDGSSSFGSATRFGNFGSVGAGWIFLKDSWCKKHPLLSWGKLRGSFGITGSQNATPYAYLSSFVSGLNQYGDWPTLQLARPSNPALGWAQASTVELGIDLYFLKDQRLKFATQWYRKITTNQLVNHQVTAVTGTNISLLNLPAKVENSGVEATLDYNSQPRGHESITWNVQTNFAVNKNKLIRYPGLESSPFIGEYEIGKPIVWQELYTTFIDQSLGFYSNVDSMHPDPNRYKVDRYPAFTGGIQASVIFHQFTLSVSCTFAKQQGFTNVQGTTYPGELSGSGNGNQDVSVVHEDRWRSPEDVGKANAFHVFQLANPKLDIYWGDVSYMEVKNASLTYSFSQSVLNKLRVSGINFYVRAENLLVLSLADYKGMNPEQPALPKQQLPLRRVLVGGFTINL